MSLQLVANVLQREVRPATTETNQLLAQADQHLFRSCLNEIRHPLIQTKSVSIPLGMFCGGAKTGCAAEDIALLHQEVTFIVAKMPLELTLRTRDLRGNIAGIGLLLELIAGVPSSHRLRLVSPYKTHEDTREWYLPGLMAMNGLLSLRYGNEAMHLYPDGGVVTQTELCGQVFAGRWPAALSLPGGLAIVNPHELNTGPYGTALHDFYHAERLSSHAPAVRKAAALAAERVANLSLFFDPPQKAAVETLLRVVAKVWTESDPLYSQRLTAFCAQTPGPERDARREKLKNYLDSAVQKMLELECLPIRAVKDFPSALRQHFKMSLARKMRGEEAHFLRSVAYELAVACANPSFS